jgi:nucleoside-diphosphate-sugar epimerase
MHTVDYLRASEAPPSPSGVVVTGASGWLGSRVVDHLLATGRPVISVGRSQPDRQGIRHIAFDLEAGTREPAGLEEVLALAQQWAVIHCAGLAHVDQETTVVRDRLRRTNADGTLRMLEMCRRLGIERFVYVSTTAVYGWAHRRDEVAANEDEALLPETAYGESKLAGERAVMASGLDWRIARLATMFGEGDHANFLRMARAVKGRRFLLPGDAAALKSCIPVTLAARSLARFAAHDAPNHRLVNLTLASQPTLREICLRLSLACRSPLPISLPIRMMATAARLGDLVGRLGMRPPLNSEILTKLTTSTAVNSERAAELFPETASTTFESAMAECGDYYAKC